MTQQRVGRRKFLGLSGTALVGMALIGCQPAVATPVPSVAKPAAPASPPPAAPTTGPAAVPKPPATAAPAAKAPVTKVRLVAGASTLSTILSNQSVGMGLGFYRDEGLEVELAVAAGSGSAGQLVATGKVEFANSTPPLLLEAANAGSALPIVTVYTWTKDIHWMVAVMPDSPIKEIKDLKGKKIGFVNQSDSAYAGGRGMLREVGLDPDKDAEWIATGVGAPAAEALKSGRVDALSLWDGLFADIEGLGFKFRYLPPTPDMKELFGAGISVSRDYLKNHRNEVIGFLRAMTKGAIFALENPIESVKLHWSLFPESKPKGKSEAEAMEDALRTLKSRSPKWQLDPVKQPKYGWNYGKGWETYVKFLGLNPEKVGDVSKYYTNDLIDEVNSFDQEALKKLAREYKFKG